METLENNGTRLVVKDQDTKLIKPGVVLIFGGIVSVLLGMLLPAIGIIFMGVGLVVMGGCAIVFAKPTKLVADSITQTVDVGVSGLLAKKHVKYTFLEIEKIRAVQSYTQLSKSLSGMSKSAKSPLQPRLETTTQLVMAGGVTVDIDRVVHAAPADQAGPVPLEGIGPALAALMDRQLEIIPPTGNPAIEVPVEAAPIESVSAAEPAPGPVPVQPPAETPPANQNPAG